MMITDQRCSGSPVRVPGVTAGGEAGAPVPDGLRADLGQGLADGGDHPGPQRGHLQHGHMVIRGVTMLIVY